MQEETLSLDYHIRRLVLKALNKTFTKKDAAGLLGVSEKTLYLYGKRYGIRADEKTGVYFIPNNKKLGLHSSISKGI
jgi:hypothetical protein